MEVECYKSDITLKQVNPAYTSKNTYINSIAKNKDEPKVTEFRHFGAALIISML